ncbi:unnamed protein product [Closterium sp. NIES-64]|nr:unnamed protein product [Closterium sp. NIES-64]
MAATAPTANLPSPLISKPLRFCLPELPFKHISSPHPLSASPEPPPPPPSSPPRATPPSLSASEQSPQASPHLSNPPKPLRIWSPKPASATALPVLLFQHGFSAQTIYYSRLLSRVASHGFIVVAPQPFYPVPSFAVLCRHFSSHPICSHLSSSLPPGLPPAPLTSSPISKSNSNPPRPLRIWSPKPATATALPVLLFQHGFSAQTSMYSQLLTRIAKHGYIVVAPQVCGCVHSVYRWAWLGSGEWMVASSSSLISPFLSPPHPPFSPRFITT